MLPFRTIICPTDFSEPSYEALARAEEVAVHFGAELCVAHVVPQMRGIPPDPLYVFEGPEEYQRIQLEGAEQQLREVIEQRVAEGVKSRTIIKQGEAADEILRTAEEEGADLIVVATHGLTGWRHLVFGSVAEKLIRAAHCPVLTIRASRQSES